VAPRHRSRRLRNASRARRDALTFCPKVGQRTRQQTMPKTMPSPSRSRDLAIEPREHLSGLAIGARDVRQRRRHPSPVWSGRSWTISGGVAPSGSNGADLSEFVCAAQSIAVRISFRACQSVPRRRPATSISCWKRSSPKLRAAAYSLSGERRRDRQDVAHECRCQFRGDGEVALEAAQRSCRCLVLQAPEAGGATVRPDGEIARQSALQDRRRERARTILWR
jgi:hypothetical protein